MGVYADNPLIDLSRNPRYRREPLAWSHSRTEVNRACGDELTFYLEVEADGRIGRIGYTGEGCSVCLASAELVCRLCDGADTEVLVDASDAFRRFLDPSALERVRDHERFDFSAFADLRSYPMRQKCALMAWDIVREIAAEFESGANRCR